MLKTLYINYLIACCNLLYVSIKLINDEVLPINLEHHRMTNDIDKTIRAILEIVVLFSR